MRGLSDGVQGPPAWRLSGIRTVGVLLLGLLLAGVAPGRGQTERSLPDNAWTSTGTTEYCKSDSFNATCPQGQIIVMETARYGRMKVGKCIKHGYGHVGCSANVLSYMDSQCSGRTQCSVKVSSMVDLNVHPCDLEFSSHLEASYSCVHAASIQPSNCVSEPEVRLLPERASVYEVHHSERVPCPWSVHADPGQSINVTLYDFGSYGNQKHGRLLCHRLAVVRETGAGKETSVCSGRERVRNVYLSDGHVINIQPINVNHRKHVNRHYFMLKYTALGCPTPSMAYPYHLSREGDSLIISCNVTKDIWRQECIKDAWVGSYGNCTDAEAAPSKWDLLSRGWASPFGIIVVVGLGIVLGVLFGVVLLSLAVCLLKRRSRKGRGLGNGPYIEEVYQEPRPTETDELRMFDTHAQRRLSYTDHLWKYPPSVMSSERAPSSGYQTMTSASGSCGRPDTSYNTGSGMLSAPGGFDHKGHSPKIRAKVQTIVHT